MREFSLPPRLAALAERVRPGAAFADIGTDHALLPVWLIRRGIITRAIAADLREGPLERARQTARRHGTEDAISFRLGDGLAVLRPGEADTIAIAGMGGDVISHILAAAPWLKEARPRLLLQPMSAVEDLRLWLWKNSFTILEETLRMEGRRRYVALEAAVGPASPMTPGELWAGRQSPGMDAPLRGPYLRDCRIKAERALAGLRQSKRPSDLPRRRTLEAVAEDLARMEKEWNAWQR